MNISPVILKDDNFQEWEKSLQNSFCTKHKLGFVDGKISKPNNDATEIEDCWSVNLMLVGWILQ